MPDEIPLFPLDLVLLPSCYVPLHIFEERYRTMTNLCIEEDKEFGIVWGQDDDHRSIGCSARIADVVDRFPDGRLNIVVQGTERFNLLDEHHDAPYITGIVETLPDEEDLPDATLVDRARELYSDALKITLGWIRPNADETDERALSYTIAASLGLPLERQQQLLEMRNAGDRLEEVAGILEGSIENLQDADRKMRGNGKA